MTLSVNSLIRVTVNLAPVAAARRGFGMLLIVGDSSVIDMGERIRTYTTLEGVAADFGVSAPEYLAAELYYSQTPKPLNLAVGRWARTATPASIRGAILTDAEKQMSNWTAITAGSFTISIDGTPQTVDELDFSGQTNLNGVANIINDKLTGATIAWDGTRFTIVADSTGATSKVGYATGDLAAMLKMTASTALVPTDGADAESPLEAVTSLADESSAWYGLMFAASTMPTDDEKIAIAGFIEAATTTRIFGITETDTRALDATWTDDIGSRLKALGYKRSPVQYSQNPYAIASLFGRAFSVNFNANRSTITLMYKQEPGIVAENLTATQAATLKTKNINVFVQYDNDTAIVQWGTMPSGAYFDEIHGLDWFADAVQNALYNLLYQSKTKIPQTEEGQTQLLTEAASVCDEGVNNGLIAPGVWNADGFGQLQRGDYLDSGYYLFSAPVADQAQSIREQRTAQPIQIAVKLAGAIHDLDVLIDVNR